MKLIGLFVPAPKVTRQQIKPLLGYLRSVNSQSLAKKYKGATSSTCPNRAPETFMLGKFPERLLFQFADCPNLVRPSRTSGEASRR